MKERSLAKYLNETLISFLHVHTREEAIFELVNSAYLQNKLQNKPEFLQAILEREKIVSTGIGMGVAIPHAKLAGLSDFFVCIGIQKGQPIEWDSIDNSFVNLIFLIGGPENQQKEYLQILSLITISIKDEKLRKKLLNEEIKQKVLENLISY